MKQIWNATTFQEFVTAVAGGNKTLNARLTPSAASIDLSSIAGSFSSIEGYKGTFDGNGKTLDFGTETATQPLFDDLQGVVKNLTLNSTIAVTDVESRNWGIFAKTVAPSLEVDDVPGLQNCTAEGSITWTPASALAGNAQLGGLVGNNFGGTITGCTNNASVTFANNGVTNGNQPSIGGVVGRTQKGGDLKTQGEISNCNNYGTVICAAQFEGNVMVGGILGYAVEKAESMSGCTNHGLVKAASTASTNAALHLGGVVGLAKGIMENCTNASDGVVTSEACSASTYICQGGVAGRFNNDAGLTYETLTNAGTLNVAAAGDTVRTLVGGVVGRCNEGSIISGVTNSGSINYTANNTSSKETYIGGIVASNTRGGTSLSGCNSTSGTLSYTGSNANGPLYIGGVVAYSTRPVSSCTSSMTLNIGGSFEPTLNNYYSTGGIVGYMKEDELISGCLNTGNITWSQQLVSNGFSFLGGVVGNTKGSVENSSNGGTITFSGKNAANDPFIGGLVGSTHADNTHSITGKYGSATATNYGSVVINTSVQATKQFYVGGVVGRLHSKGSLTATNSGTINVTNLTCALLDLGGLAGLANGTVNSGSSNLAAGDITVSGLTTSQISYIGGVVGRSAASITATNYGDVTLTNGSTCGRDLYVGGIVGNTTAALSTCTNSGAVSNACPMTGSSYNMHIGGIAGATTSSTVSSCHNTVTVENTANSARRIYVGGLCGYCTSEVSSSDNTGNVTNSGNTGNKEALLVGGLFGEAGEAVSSSHNSGAVSNSGDSAEDICLGGLSGNNYGQTFTTCYNTGAVSNSGVGGTHAVGGIAGWSSAGSTYSSACYNTGAVSNSSNATTASHIGGLIGHSRAVSILTSTTSTYNYNNGTVTDSSSSREIAIGGICGFANNYATNFTYCRNLSGGTITITNGSPFNAYVAGILGIAGDHADGDNVVTLSLASNSGAINVTNVTVGNVLAVGGVLGQAGGTVPVVSGTDSDHQTTNSGNITFTSCTIGEQLRLGGVVGAYDDATAATVAYCTNSGTITSSAVSNLVISSTNNNYVGGIIGNGQGKTIQNCYNTSSGVITIYSSAPYRLGGIVGYTDKAPTNCTSSANITFMSSASSGTRPQIGGIAGYCNVGAFSDLKYNGSQLKTNGSYWCYMGGIVGRTDKNCTFTRCKVGGNIWGAKSGQGQGRFFCNAYKKSGQYSFTFPDCVVAEGAMWNNSETVTTSTGVNIGQCAYGTLASGGVLPTVGSID